MVVRGHRGRQAGPVMGTSCPCLTEEETELLEGTQDPRVIAGSCFGIGPGTPGRSFIHSSIY